MIARKTYLLVFAALPALLLVTVAAAYVELGRLNPIVALTIPICKALLIILYFMPLRHSTPLTWVVAAAGFLRLGILMVMTPSDYLTRGWLSLPGR